MASSTDEWVVLKQVSTDGQARFTQVGPFATPEVIRKIHAGEIAFSDYAWKKGMKEWVFIRDIPEFSQSPEAGNVGEAELMPDDITVSDGESVSDVEGENGDSVSSADEVLDISNIEIQDLDLKKHHLPSLDEVVPDEVDGPNLVGDDETAGEIESEDSPSQSATQEIVSDMKLGDQGRSTGSMTIWNDEGSSIIDFSETKELFGAADIAHIEEARREDKKKRVEEELQIVEEQEQEFVRLVWRKRLKVLLAASVGILIVGGGLYLFLHNDGAVNSERSGGQSAANPVRAAPMVQSSPAQASIQDSNSGQVHRQVVDNTGTDVESSPAVAGPAATPEGVDAKPTGGLQPGGAHPVAVPPVPTTTLTNQVQQPMAQVPQVSSAIWKWLPWQEGRVVPPPMSLLTAVGGNGLKAVKLSLPPGEMIQRPLILRFIGRAGDLLNGRSIHKALRISATNGQPSVLEFSRLGLPEGDYVIYGLDPSVSKTFMLSLGVKEPGFLEQLNKYRISIRPQRQLELKEMQGVLARLNERCGALEKGSRLFLTSKTWLNFSRKWKRELFRSQPEALNKISWHSADNYFYPEEWIELKAVQMALIKISADQAVLVKKRRPPKLNLGRQRKEISNLKSKIKKMQMGL